MARVLAAEEAARNLGAARAGAELLPPDARPGQCYARVFVPPKYETEKLTVLKSEASERVEIIPAKYEFTEEKVLIKEASQKVEVVPAQYDWAEEKVLMKPAATKLLEVPAEYEVVEEKVLVRPAQTVWKKGRGPIERIDYATGEIMCLVEEPAVYETVKKRVLKAAATTKKVEIPADYKILKKKVMTKAPTTRTIEIPAEYKTVKVNRVVSPAREERIEIPAKYETVVKTVKVADGRMEWRQVLCETNMTSDIIVDVQRALLGAGHDPGPIDGIYGGRTRAAVRSFQQAKNLPRGGLGTLSALGVTPEERP